MISNTVTKESGSDVENKINGQVANPVLILKCDLAKPVAYSVVSRGSP